MLIRHPSSSSSEISLPTSSPSLIVWTLIIKGRTISAKTEKKQDKDIKNALQKGTPKWSPTEGLDIE